MALRHFPNAHVLMPELSYYIIERVLHNSVNVMTRQRDELGIREYPLYTHDEVDDIAPLFQGFKYNREIEWAAFHKTRAGLPSPTLEFFDAGHTLGGQRQCFDRQCANGVDAAADGCSGCRTPNAGRGHHPHPHGSGCAH